MSESGVVEARGLSKTYRRPFRRQGVKALDSLDLHIDKGEILGLLGPNGAGKTTTIHLLLGFLHPTAGKVRVLGADPSDVRTKSRIGFLPEESYFYRFLTGEELLHYFGRLFGIPRAERRRRVDALLREVGMGGARNRRLREYSKGMLRRIGIAQSLLNDPEFVILDEPTSGLDPIGNREVKDLILGLKRRGTTVLLSSHLLADLEEVCDRVVMLYGGRKIREGRVQDLLTRTELRTVSFRGLDEGALEGVRRAAEAQGAEVVHVGNPVDSLEQFFLRTLKETESK